MFVDKIKVYQNPYTQALHRLYKHLNKKINKFVLNQHKQNYLVVFYQIELQGNMFLPECGHLQELSSHKI